MISQRSASDSAEGRFPKQRLNTSSPPYPTLERMMVHDKNSENMPPISLILNSSNELAMIFFRNQLSITQERGETGLDAGLNQSSPCLLRPIRNLRGTGAPRFGDCRCSCAHQSTGILSSPCWGTEPPKNSQAREAPRRSLPRRLCRDALLFRGWG